MVNSCCEKIYEASEEGYFLLIKFLKNSSLENDVHKLFMGVLKRYMCHSSQFLVFKKVNWHPRTGLFINKERK